MIAMALALEPRRADRRRADHRARRDDAGADPALIRDLQKRKGTSVLFITHDFGVVAEIADRVAVMQQGRLVEQGPAARC
jgi:peptide/nickel transport system ATP-binding protein